jgi:hypothetical protein
MTDRRRGSARPRLDETSCTTHLTMALDLATTTTAQVSAVTHVGVRWWGREGGRPEGDGRQWPTQPSGSI